ncbi:hypothetical protein JAAARDRAFT_28665 [Jaapia argillacea MUCL 33604]|uniref:Isochorismatase-like domain-containing protein n=1 Tax=Jaapia argillacea MUCL 33604 TaxID=933084 RepID=A0A067QDJ0_9AGAM|nr:hypothetical protein JAAARDRAFT_28665 [Jaapia argillacea MUCL 33604]
MSCPLRSVSYRMSSVAKLHLGKTAIFICDIQTKFRTAIHSYDNVIKTANKMLKLAKILQIPVIVTEQNPKGLGSTVPELLESLEPLGPLHLGTFGKSLFSMCTDEFNDCLKKNDIKSCIIVGIESHVCVLQSTLDLLEQGYDVHILADGVSSCNKEEIPYALARMRQSGAIITTSECVAFQLQVDAKNPTFKAFSNLIKEEKESTKDVLQTLLPTRSLL